MIIQQMRSLSNLPNRSRTKTPLTVCGQTVLLSNASLANAISVLPEQAREEILRYYFLHQSQRVIGACIGQSRSTAGRHIQIALRKLREEMERYRHE